MRVVADTNTVVSGLLWHEPPRRILDAGRRGSIALFTSLPLLLELEDVLLRRKFAARLVRAGVAARELVLGYATLASIVEPETMEPIVLQDPPDDQVLACALAAHAEVIVSGDAHLLALKSHRGIEILDPASASVRFTSIS